MITSNDEELQQLGECSLRCVLDPNPALGAMLLGAVASVVEAPRDVCCATPDHFYFTDDDTGEEYKQCCNCGYVFR